MPAEGPHRRRDGHLVVVDHDQQVEGQGARVIQGLEGHAGAQGPVADDGDDVAPLPRQTGGDRHPEGGADRGAGMSDAEGVVRALAALGEAGQAALLAQGPHAGPSSGQDLVGIGLVTHVPHETVPGGIEDVMERDGELHHAQPGGQVTTRLGDAVDQEAAQLRRELGELGLVETAQVLGVVDRIQEGVRHISVEGAAGVGLVARGSFGSDPRGLPGSPQGSPSEIPSPRLGAAVTG